MIAAYATTLKSALGYNIQYIDRYTRDDIYEIKMNFL